MRHPITSALIALSLSLSLSSIAVADGPSADDATAAQLDAASADAEPAGVADDALDVTANAQPWGSFSYKRVTAMGTGSARSCTVAKTTARFDARAKALVQCPSRWLVHTSTGAISTGWTGSRCVINATHSFKCAE